MNIQKGFGTAVIIAFIALLAVAGVFYAAKTNTQEDGEENMMTGDETMMEDGKMNSEDNMASDDEMMKDDVMMDKDGSMQEDTIMKDENGSDSMMMDGGMMWDGKTLAGSSSPLLDFTKKDYDAALASGKLVVLYFYANWCPICKEETANALYPAFNALTENKVIGFRVNYNDNETDANEKNLAREFGVAYQHTKVILKNGSRILKSPESWSKERYMTEINKALTN